MSSPWVPLWVCLLSCVLSSCTPYMGHLALWACVPARWPECPLSVLQSRTMCAACREAMSRAPAASSPCLTGGLSVSRTPASPPSSVSKGVCPAGPRSPSTEPVCPRRHGVRSLLDSCVGWKVRMQLFSICIVSGPHVATLSHPSLPATDQAVPITPWFPYTVLLLLSLCLNLSPNQDHSSSVCHF